MIYFNVYIHKHDVFIDKSLSTINGEKIPQQDNTRLPVAFMSHCSMLILDWISSSFHFTHVSFSVFDIASFYLFKVEFQATVGSTSSDIAVDDITILGTGNDINTTKIFWVIFGNICPTDEYMFRIIQESMATECRSHGLVPIYKRNSVYCW